MSDVVGSAQVIIEPAGLAEFERELERGVTDALEKIEQQFGEIDKAIDKSAKSAKKLSDELPGQLNFGDIGNISEQLSFGDLGGEVAEGFAAVTGEATEAVAGVAGETSEAVAGIAGETTEALVGVAGEISETFAGIGGEISEALAGVAGEAAETGAAVSGELTEAGVGAAALGGRLGGIGQALKFIGPLVAGVGVAAFFKSAASEASILQESTTKVQAVFGDLSPQLEEFAATSAESFAVAESAALGAVGTFGNLFTALGVSTEVAAELAPNLVALSADLASFNDLAGGSEEALISLRAAITGEFEPLRRLGVALTDVAVRNRAVELGLADTAVTASVQSRVLARYDLILEQTANQQNDFARTSQFLANQQRSLAAEFKTLQANVGTALQPVLLALIDVARELLPSFEQIASIVAELAGVFVSALAPVLQALAPAFEALSQSLGSLAVQLGPVLIEIGESLGEVLAELVVGFGGLLVSLGPTLANLGDLAVILLNAVAPALQVVLGFISQLPDWFQEAGILAFAFGKALGAVAPAATSAYRSIQKFFEAGQFLTPTKLAVVGLTAALAVGVTVFEAAGRASRELDEDVKELTASLVDAAREATTAFEAVEEFVGIKFEEDIGDEALEQLNALGVGIDDVITSIQAGGDSLEPIREALRGLGIDLESAAPKDEIVDELEFFQGALANINEAIDQGNVLVAAGEFERLGVSIPEGAGLEELTARLRDFDEIANLNQATLAGSLDAIEEYDEGAQRSAKAALEQLQFQGDITEERKNSAIAAAQIGEEEFNYAAALQEVDADLFNVIESEREGTEVTYEFSQSVADLIQDLQGADRAAAALSEALGESARATLEAADAQAAANARVQAQKDSINDQIKALERQKTAVQETSQAQRDSVNAQIKNIERQRDAAKKGADARKDAIDAQIKGIQKQKKALQEAAKVEEKARKEQADAIKKLNDVREAEVAELQKLEDEARRAFSGFVSEADILADALADLPDKAEVSLSAFQETIKDNLSRTASFIAGIRILISRGANDLAAFLLQQGEGAEKALDEALGLNDAQLEGQERFIEDYGGFNDEVLSELDRYIDQLDGVDVPEFEPLEVPEVEVDISDAVAKFDAQIEALQESADKIDIDLSGAVDNFDAQIDRLRASAEKIDISANVESFDAQIEQLRASIENVDDAVPTFADFQAARQKELDDQGAFTVALKTLYDAGAFNLVEFYAQEGTAALAAAQESARQAPAEIARREAVFAAQLEQQQFYADDSARIGLEAKLAGELYGKGLTDEFLDSFDPSIIANAYAQLEGDTATEADVLKLLIRNQLQGFAAETGIGAQKIADTWDLEFDLSDPAFDELEAVEEAIFGKQDDTGEASAGLSSFSSERFENEFQWAAPTNAELDRTARQIELDQSIGSASFGAGKEGRDRFGRGLRLDIETSKRINEARQSFAPVIQGNSLLNRDAAAAGSSTAGSQIDAYNNELNAASSPGGSSWNANVNFIEQAEAAQRQAAEARSPSRLFARLGDDIAAGTAMGIKDGIASRSGGLFDALTRELQGAGKLSADLEANIGAGSLGAVELPALVGAGAVAAGGSDVGQSVRIEQNVTVQAPLGMSDTEAERIGTLIAQNARSNVVNSVRTGSRATRTRA